MSGPNESNPNSPCVMDIFRELLPRSVIKELLSQSKGRFYWRLFTPLIMLWGFIYQRLSPDQTCDGALSHLSTGSVDDLDPEDKHKKPWSERLNSENTSAYVQGRNRLPLDFLKRVLYYIYSVILDSLKEKETGHQLRWLDGTTVRTRPFGDLEKDYGQAQNQHGTAYWVVIRVMVAICVFSEAVVSVAEATTKISEAALVRQIMEQDPVKGCIYIADQGLGVYRTVQVAKALGHYVLLRVNKRTAKRLWRESGTNQPLESGSEHSLEWSPTPTTKVDLTLPALPVEGRLIYFRLEQQGFRPIDLYIFTTCIGSHQYTAEKILELYGLRWRIEINLRHIKTTLGMDQFEVKSVQMFRKELVAGLITYNLIRALMVRAALKEEVDPYRLSFAKCFRRIRDVLTQGVPKWVRNPMEYLMSRLANCLLPNQPNKVKYEPRKIRRRPVTYPALKGSRQAARQRFLNNLAN